MREENRKTGGGGGEGLSEHAGGGVAFLGSRETTRAYFGRSETLCVFKRKTRLVMKICSCFVFSGLKKVQRRESI